MKTYNLGIIGAGMYGKILMRCFAKDLRANVTWVNSASETTTRSAAEEFGIKKWTLDYHDILADPAVDAVVIATPPYLHAQQFSDSLAAGKHVLLEKPMAESVDSVRKIVEAANQTQGRVMIDASCRHTRLTRKFRFIKEIIDSGRLGTIYHIHHNHLSRGTFIEYNPYGAWAMNKKLAGGGPLADVGVYDLSFHLGLLSDKPELVSIRSFTRNDLRDMTQLVEFSDVEQHAAAWLEFSDGLTYYYERGGGVYAEIPDETRIYGTQGGLRFQSRSASNEIELFIVENNKPIRQTLTVDQTGEAEDSMAMATHFLDCLDGAEPLMPIHLAAKHMEILFRILAQ